jgi:hypothetical protein
MLFSWMQSRKLTIRVFLFPSILKKLPLPLCVACNILMNNAGRRCTLCLRPPLLAAPSPAFHCLPTCLPTLFSWMQSRKPTIRVLLFPSIQKKPRYLHVWLMNEPGRGLDHDDYHRCTLCTYSVPEAEKRGREIGEGGAPSKRGGGGYH